MKTLIGDLASFRTVMKTGAWHSARMLDKAALIIIALSLLDNS